jgi:hypothetical protein
MADRIRVSDLDFVYISYAEPNKEENWADLKNKVPHAKRVDGVKGFDNAHKAAARLAETQFFISVDKRIGVWQWRSGCMGQGHLLEHAYTRKRQRRESKNRLLLDSEA